MRDNDRQRCRQTEKGKYERERQTINKCKNEKERQIEREKGKAERKRKTDR